MNLSGFRYYTKGLYAQIRLLLKTGVCLLILGSYSCSIYAQLQSLLFNKLTIEDGLPNSSVIDLMQDDLGFIWMTTPTGIMRYDGYEIVTYQLGGSSPKVRDLPRLFQDRDGVIWVSSISQEEKLFRYDPEIDHFIPFLADPQQPAYPIQDGVFALGEDQFGHLLVGTGGMGLYVVDKTDPSAGKVIHQYLPVPEDTTSIASLDVLGNIITDHQGNNWMATLNGLCKYMPQKRQFQTFRYPDNKHPGLHKYQALFWEKPATLWVGTSDQGLLQFDLEKEIFVRQFLHDPADAFSISSNNVGVIMQQKDGRLWVNAAGPAYARINRLDLKTGRFTTLLDRANPDSPDAFMGINDFLLDGSGNVWVATWQRGVFRHNLDQEVFDILFWPDTVQKKMGDAYIQSIHEDSKEQLWIGTKGGLWRCSHSDRIFYHYPIQSQLIDNQRDLIMGEMVEDSQSHLWMIVNDELIFFDPATGRLKQFPATYSSGGHFLIKQTNGTIWLANNELGVCKVADNGQFELDSCFLSDEIRIDASFTIKEDESSCLWIGLNQSGLVRFDPASKTFKRYISDYGVHDIQFDREGKCWLVTHSAGLKIFEPKSGEIIHLEASQDNMIGQPEAVEMDARGFFWISSSNGIIQFDPINKRIIRRFSPNNWQLKNQRWHDNQITGATVRVRNGELFFGAADGLLHFHPDSVRVDSTAPQIALTAFSLFTKKLNPGPRSPLKMAIHQNEHLRLAYNQNDFTIGFAALHYKSSEENQFQFQLENYDKTWQEVTRQRTARYTNLRPGNYIFRVRAANSDGFWTQEEAGEARLLITITSPWYANIWAYGFYGISFLIGIFGGYRFLLTRRLEAAETNRLRELSAVKSRLYTNITHEFRTPLTLILGGVDELKQELKKAPVGILNRMERNGQQLLRLVNQMLGLTKVDAGQLSLKFVHSEIILFLRYLTDSFHSLAKYQGIELVFEAQVEEFYMDFDPDQLQQVVSNLLSNALKFTPREGQVRILVKATAQNLCLEIIDNGIGIPTEDLPHIFDRFFRANKASANNSIKAAEGAGIGLALTQELVQLMGGQITAESLAGKGSRFTVNIPVRHQAVQRKTRPQRDSQAIVPITPTGEMPAKSLNSALSKKPIALIVEDNADVRSYLRDCLSDSYQIEEAEDGKEGLQKAFELIPDFIISDVMMPEIDGFELCAILKADRSTSHIPIILLTAKADVQSKIAGLVKGADAYLSKPFVKKELLVRVEKLLELRQQLRFFYQSLLKPSPIESIPSPEPQEAEFVHKARQIVFEHLDNHQFSVKKLAEGLFLSRSQLNRKMQSLLGIAAVGFIRDIRLTRAQELLLQSERPISDIAYQCGFSDPRYFSRAFKKAFGMTPSNFRERR